MNITDEYTRLKAMADAANWKSYKEHCTCGGYAYPMNGRDPDDPHLSYCPQRPEFMKLKAARGSLVKGCHDMMALIDKLMAERVELLADRGRLDWLTAQANGYGCEVLEGYEWRISGAYSHLREAIDCESRAILAKTETKE